MTCPCLFVCFTWYSSHLTHASCKACVFPTHPCNPPTHAHHPPTQASILARLKEINPALVQRLCSRLFFVVNKLDVRKKEVGLDEGATREYVAQLITQQMSMAEFQLQPEQVSAGEGVCVREGVVWVRIVWVLWYVGVVVCGCFVRGCKGGLVFLFINQLPNNTVFPTTYQHSLPIKHTITLFPPPPSHTHRPPRTHTQGAPRISS